MSGTVAELIEDLEPSSRGVLQGLGRKALSYVRWDHPSPRGRVVLAHGYGEHSERYRHTARWLHDQGWSVSAMDHRGFGRSEGRRGDADGIRPFVEDLALFLRHERAADAGPQPIDSLLPPAPPHPQVLLGHSFGGLVALLTLLWHAETMDGLALTSPVVALRPMGPLLRGLQKVMLVLAPHLALDLPNDKDAVCSDPVLVQRYWEDPLCHRRASAAFSMALAEGRQEILHLGHELDRPILLLEANEDTVADPDGAEPLWQAIQPGVLERHRLMGFKHEILHDRRRAEAQAILARWLDRLAGNPAPLGATPEQATKDTQ